MTDLASLTILVPLVKGLYEPEFGVVIVPPGADPVEWADEWLKGDYVSTRLEDGHVVFTRDDGLDGYLSYHVVRPHVPHLPMKRVC